MGVDAFQGRADSFCCSKDIEYILAEAELSQINLRPASSADVPRATWIGHATVLVQYQGINLLTDPHLTDYAAPFDF